MHSIQLQGSSVMYSLIQKPKLRNISIKIKADRTVIVTAPTSVKQERIEELLNRKSSWILTKLAEFAQLPAPVKPKRFIDHETFLYIGEHYPLSLVKIDTESYLLSKRGKNFVLQFRDGIFSLIEPIQLPEEERSDVLQSLFKQFYIRRGQHLLEERLEIYTKQMGVSPNKVVFKEQKKRWGSCTGKGAIYLNWRLMMAPLSVIDYVLVHELAHLRHLNHSKEFWGFVQTTLPDYKERKTWLKEHGNQLTLA